LRPLVIEFDRPPEILSALRSVRGRGRPILFDSSLLRPPLGRYVALSADPVKTFTIDRIDRIGPDPLASIRDALAPFQFEEQGSAEFPTFTGGVAGLLSYDLGHVFERLPSPQFDEFHLPWLEAGLYDWAIVWDRLQNRAWLTSSGCPEQTESARLTRAKDRAEQVQSWLAEGPSPTPDWAHIVPSELFAPLHPLPGRSNLFSNFARADYLDAVARVIEYIRAGDIFQANLAQRLLTPSFTDPLELYATLRTVNPAPFGAYFEADDWAIASASPERFLQVTGNEVETRPIKGTRRRQRDLPVVDLFVGDELRESEKDIAENVMIVDLLRNDLSRVCRPGSIRVPHLCAVETYETVQHLVSEIRGTLQPGRDFWDLIAASLPGGSITGAPKIRAMEIIAELEQVARGPYCGSLFYLGFDGRADSNILIRSFVQRHGWVQCSVGGGVTIQSDPAAEYAETLHKAAGMLNALDAASCRT
jgi:para-aminobenzoate synthetase component 1